MQRSARTSRALSLVLGGQKSGKSSQAARIVAASGLPVVVITPAAVRDEEFARRVARHQADRPADWRTIESFDLTAALDDAGARTAVLVDALDTWLAETLLEIGITDDRLCDDLAQHAQRQVCEQIDALVAAQARREGPAVIVAGQPGLGAHAMGAASRLYVDLHGVALQRLAEHAEQVLLMVAGRALDVPHAHLDGTGADERQGPVAEPLQGGGKAAALREHGDTQVPAGHIDLAVNVEPGPPAWLRERLADALNDTDRYPDLRDATAAVAARHDRPATTCAVTAGAADAMWVLPALLRPRLVACVHPSFTEPEAAVRASGAEVVRVFRDPVHWRFDPADVPDAADMVVVGRPDNPSGAFDDVATIEQLRRPGRVLVVDEAFMEFCDDAGGFADRTDLDDVVCLRSFTKMWGLAGLRVGYITGPEALVSRIDGVRQPWPVSSLAATAAVLLADAEPERRRRAADIASRRDELHDGLQTIDGTQVWGRHANFVLLRTGHGDLRSALLERGIAVRDCRSFPGLDHSYVRLAVRDSATNRRVVAAIAEALDESRPAPSPAWTR